MHLLGRSTAALEDLKVDNAERHKAEGETGHGTGEEDKETGETSVEEPPEGSEGYISAFRLLNVAKQHYRIQRMHRPIRKNLDLLLLLLRLCLLLLLLLCSLS